MFSPSVSEHNGSLSGDIGVLDPLLEENEATLVNETLKTFQSAITSFHREYEGLGERLDSGSPCSSISLEISDEEDEEDLSGKVDGSDSDTRQNQLSVSLKDCLRKKIQNRRLSEGTGILEVFFEEPKTYPLTPDEERKNELRRKRNRASANKSRLKRLELLKKLEAEEKVLQKEHNDLKVEVESLKKLKCVLTQVLNSHKFEECDKTAHKKLGTRMALESKTGCAGPSVTKENTSIKSKEELMVAMYKAYLQDNASTHLPDYIAKNYGKRLKVN